MTDDQAAQADAGGLDPAIVRRLIKDLTGPDHAAAVQQLEALATHVPARSKDRQQLARVHVALSYYRGEAGRAAGLEHAEQALRQLQAVRRPNPVLLADAHSAAGLAAWYLSSPADAERHYRLAVQAVDTGEAGHRRALLHSLNAHALCLQNLDRYEAALADYQRALDLAEQLKLGPLVRQIARRMANTAQDQGHFGLARERLLRARPGSRASAQERLSWQHAMALLAERMVELDEAERHYDAAVRLFEDHAEAVRAQIGCLPNGGQLKADRGRLDEAKFLLELGERWESADSPAGYMLGKIRLTAKIANGAQGVEAAMAALRAGRVQLAGRKGLSPSYDQSLLLLGSELLTAAGRQQQAAAWLREGLALGADEAERPLAGEELPAGLQLAGLLVTQGKTGTTAGWIARQAMLAAGAIDDEHVQCMALSVTAELANRAGRVDSAIIFGKLAANLTLGSLAAPGSDTIAAGTVLAQRHDAIRRLSEYLVSQGRLDENRQVRSALRQRESFELGNRRANLAGHVAELTFTDREERIAGAYGTLIGQLRALAATANDWSLGDAERQEAATAFEPLSQYLVRLIEAALQPAEAAPERPKLSAAFNRARADDRTAVLRYHQGESETLLEVETAGGTRHHRIAVGRAEFAGLVADFTERLLVGQSAGASGRVLFDHLFAPAQGDLAGADGLDLVVDGALAHLPFAALHDGQGYLIERLPIRYRTGARANRAPAWSKPGRIAVFGVSQARRGFDALPDVPEELRGIRAQFNRAVRGFSDGRFTAGRLAGELGRSPDIVHIASHFQLSPGSAEKSRLLLGGGKSVSAAGLADTRYAWDGVQLVFLSACETGTHGVDGETLAAMLQRLGAGQVIASLWPVFDSSTAALVAAFYREIGNGAEPALALQRAQSGLLRLTPAMGQTTGARRRMASGSMAHPVNWSAFKVFVPGD